MFKFRIYFWFGDFSNPREVLFQHRFKIVAQSHWFLIIISCLLVFVLFFDISLSNFRPKRSRMKFSIFFSF